MADSERPDAEWVRLAQTGDRAAYGALVRRHQDRIHRHLLHLTGSREEALELAQEVHQGMGSAAGVAPGRAIPHLDLSDRV